MIKLGNTDIKDVKLGSSQVKKVYQGNNLVWQKYSAFAVPILDLDFQNNLTDKSGNYTMTGSSLPTFGLSGRKAGEYSANFNGSQSIRTNENLLLNSDKVTVSFWIKTIQTSIGLVTELSSNYNSYNAFAIIINDLSPNKIYISDHNLGYNVVNSNDNINNGLYKHIILCIDRSQVINQNKIYIDGVSSFVQNTSFQYDNNGIFNINPLYIGQSGGSSIGFNGTLINFKVYNQVPTDSQAMEVYQNEL